VNPLRSSLLAASRSEKLKRSMERFGPAKSVVDRFVGGSTDDSVLTVALTLASKKLLVTVDHLGEDVVDAAGAGDTVQAYESLVPKLASVGAADVSVKLTALGLTLNEPDALARARHIVDVASAHNLTVTIDMETSALTDATLRVVRELRAHTPSVAAVLQAMLRRTETDARELGAEGARVRLCKGAYAEGADVAFQRRQDVNASYVRSLTLLWESPGTPLVATHDPSLVTTASELSRHRPRPFEFQMLYGVRPQEQERLADLDHVVRVYVPYGEQWYGYLMRRLAERPANVAFFLRSLGSRR
jgi:proline dehydrogenase